jgi:pimeloyl-ACP methyl ester carboxylesterase
MGGWLALLIARNRPELVAGLVTIAAAPDFTEWHFRADLDAELQAQMARDGQVAFPSDYAAPYVVTRHLIDEARAHLVMAAPLALPMPVRFLQGTADADVPVSLAVRLLNHATGPDIRLMLVKGADHRFSTEACLALLGQTLDQI